MTDEREFDDLSRELHATRDEPHPDFARELDRRAAGWLREKPRRRLPSMRIAIPAVGAAAGWRGGAARRRRRLRGTGARSGRPGCGSGPSR
jgi:hypothetical protein